MDAPERLIVIGAGAIGASVGALVFETGVPVVLVARGEHESAMRNGGVDLRLPDGPRRVRAPVARDIEELEPTTRDLVVVATMGHDTEAAIATVDPSITIASFQNGLAPVEAIARRGHPTLAAMVYVPAERRGPGVVALSCVPVFGTVLVGRWPNGAHPWAPWLADTLVAAGFRAEAVEDIAPWLRAKLLTNLGGIVFALSDDPDAGVIEAAREEARAVWRATGAPFEDVPALLARVGDLESVPIDGRPRVGGSTRAALARGDQLETACLHASILDDGRAAGVPTPVNEALVRLAERATRERFTAGALDRASLRALLRDPDARV